MNYSSESESGSGFHRLIRSKRTLKFLTTQGSWTDDLRAAAQFLQWRHAKEAVLQFHLLNVELYYFFGDREQTEYDFALPLR